MSMKEIKPRETLAASVSIPGSKSLSHRALIAASLATGESRITNLLECEDTSYTLKALQGLGIGIKNNNGITTIVGKGGRFPVSPGIRTLFLGNSGTSLRLLLSTAALARGETILTGSPRLQERPVGELIKALGELGVQDISAFKENFAPVRIRSEGIKGGKTRLTGRESSQYLSSLLLAAPLAGAEVEIEVEESLVSRPYVDLTLEVMDRFGVGVQREGYRRFKVPAGPGYRPADYQVEGDASSASYFWAAAALTGGTVATENLFPKRSRQGDMAFLVLLEKMGARVRKESRRVIVKGRTLVGIEADMSAMPDMVPTLAVLALFAQGKTVIRNVAHLRHKESDRLQALREEWTRLGARIEERPDGLIIEGSAPLNGTLCDPHNDHRLAMSLAVIGLRVPGIRIRQAGCVKKSFPSFWEYWDRLK
jgi:3-phosphoshikimate 1-carboxyvinyltransferase